MNQSVKLAGESVRQAHKRPQKALITGITGQDGAYLAEFLLSKGYEVHGIKRRTSSFNTSRIDHLYRDQHEAGVRLFLHHGDMTDSSSLIHIIEKVQPDGFYHRTPEGWLARYLDAKGSGAIFDGSNKQTYTRVKK